MRTTRSLRRWVRYLAVAMLALLPLTACSASSTDDPDEEGETTSEDDSDGGGDGEEAAGEPVELTYYTFSAAPDHLEDLDAIVAGFEEENPGVTIDVQTAAFDEYFTQLQTRVASGETPDTFELNYENFVTYAKAGTLMDLSSMGGDTIDADRFYGDAYEVFSQDGTQYGLPATFSNVVLFYNKDLFDAAGLDYPTADWTWEDERAAAEQLTDADNRVWGTFQPISFFEFFKVLAQNGGEFFNADTTEATFASAEGIEAAQWLLDKPGTIMPTDADMGGQDDAAMFAAGELAMWHNGIWQFAAMQDVDFEWDIVVEPGNDTNATHFFANAVVASSTTEHPDEAAAWIQYLASSDTAVETRLAADWELPAVSDQSLFDSWLQQTPPENREAVFASLEEVVVPPVIADQSRMQDAVSGALEQAKLGQVDAETALQQAAAEVQELLDQ